LLIKNYVCPALSLFNIFCIILPNNSAYLVHSMTLEVLSYQQKHNGSNDRGRVLWFAKVITFAKAGAVQKILGLLC
jgi:hypothetical protein